MKKDAFYFPHFTNARHDRKLKRVQKELGLEGYAIYFQLLEILREQIDFKYPLKDIDLLADEMGTSEPKIKAVIANYDLFTIVDECFFSIKQIYYLQPYIEKTQRARLAANKRWNNLTSDANAMQMHNKCNADAMQVKESKVKESKLKESNELRTLQNSNLYRQPTIPTIEEVEFAFLQSGGSKEMAKIFFEKNNATGWFLKGSPIVNFRNLLPSFITNFKTNEQRNSVKSRQQTTNETIAHIKRKGAALYSEIIAENNRNKE